MPGLGVSWLTPQGFDEAWFGPFRLTPARRAQPRGQRAQRIARRDFRGTVVLFERFVVAMVEFERVAELDPRDGALRTENLGQRACLILCTPHLPHAGVYTDQEPAFRDRFGPLAQVRLELLGGFCRSPFLHQEPCLVCGLGMRKSAAPDESAETDQPERSDHGQ